MKRIAGWILVGAGTLCPVVAQQRVVISEDGSMVFSEGMLEAPSASAPAKTGDERAAEEGKPSELEKKLAKLEYDRRPSAILAAWAKPPEEEETEGERDGEEAALAAAEDATEAVQDEPPTPEAEDASEPEPEPVIGPMPQADAEAEEKARKQAEKEAAKAEKERQKELEKQQEKAEAEAIERELKTLVRDVTLGAWDAVEAYLASLTEREGKAAYKQILTSLVAGPKKKPQVPNQGRRFLETNRISPDDVLQLAGACPVELEKEQLTQLGQLLAKALGDGHQLEAFLALVGPHLDEEGYALGRRELARILTHAEKPLFLGDYLPASDAAIASDDREGLNLLSRHYLALYADEGLTSWLEEAWKVTLAVLAVGEVDEVEKQEALTRAVDMAPKLREELGQAWLDESFTARPERGMEIVAVLGSKTSKALSELPLDSTQRLKLLELQATAVHALLEAAPELAASWRHELGLMAETWLREAMYTYQNDQSTSLGPTVQRDPFGNVFYFSSGPRRNMNMPSPLKTGEILDVRMQEPWLAHLDETLRPRALMMVAQLYLKVSEEARAFPYIERVAESYPRATKELVDEFLRVWAKNNDPNKDRNYSIYIYGYNQRASGIPLTRSKQERNLEQLAEWVARLRALPVELDEDLVTAAFTTAHSAAEIYRLESIERIFGPLEELQPSTLAQLIQRMRANLVGIWRDPALQEEKQTKRSKKDIQAEILRGYELARSTLEAALEQHPESWELVLARACLQHDENNYQKELAPDSDSSARRRAALAEFPVAAGLYARSVEGLTKDDESNLVYERWFYSALGAADLDQVAPEMTLATAQIPEIREALLSLPGEAAERHMERFASTLFARMSSANPGVKFRYVQQGLEIVGDHELARDARGIHDYYNDLITEIDLVVQVDGSDTVGHEEPFGLSVDLRHTQQIERESGGFGKYLQNQNAANYGFNFGRPTEDYRDKFEDGAREVLSEHFEVLSVTFNDPKTRSRAEPEYGWRVTPYAYLLVKPRGPQVDRVPSLRLDLDFLDTTGYAVLPVESSPLPIDATGASGDERPFEELALTQRLDERQAADGKLKLEIEAAARGLVPGLEAIANLAPEGFEVAGTDDTGVAVIEFADDGRTVLSRRTWTVTLKADEDLAELPEEFTFAEPKVQLERREQYRYVDADLIPVEPVIRLEERYGEVSQAWLWWIPVGLLLAGGALFFLRGRGGHQREAAPTRFPMPDPLTPFSVLGLLRDIQQNNGLSSGAREELVHEIDAIEQHFFVEEAGDEPDLRRIAESWAGRARN